MSELIADPRPKKLYCLFYDKVECIGTFCTKEEANVWLQSNNNLLDIPIIKDNMLMLLDKFNGDGAFSDEQSKYADVVFEINNSEHLLFMGIIIQRMFNFVFADYCTSDYKESVVFDENGKFPVGIDSWLREN